MMQAMGGPKRRLRGFTLVEMLIVVVIIGILAVIALPKLFSAIDRAKEGRTFGYLGAMRDSLKLYAIDHGGVLDKWNRYPYEVNQLFTGCTLHPSKPHVYMEPDDDGIGPLPEEEVGDGPKEGDQLTSWCSDDHSYHKNRSVQGPDKGGWNWCIPGGAWPPGPTAPASGTIWIDENATSVMDTGFNYL